MLALAALDELGRGEYLRMTHRREPFLLFEKLDGGGFGYDVRAGSGDAPCEIFIWRDGDRQAESEARQIAEALPPFEAD